ncbi:hypothetical protein DKM44_04945 [Deinococcus irradiatisoli]|uniref:Uncharacterized protein n=1 Tax=Deinococcus irradiatisoli TaxID=2202254 RepID=A0A2Z3JGP2_9DEIO|nr:hypothetical protein [Deinococcus irradiatisoli]AWN22661.1 hypothetical protein DKM44_04945 [Deinococcus irradiatisoli]
MSLTKTLKRVALIGAGLLTSSALALTPVLTPDLTAQAVKEGDTMSRDTGVYTWGPYLIKTYTEDVRLQPDSPEVDGIALGTPYERLRYESFIQTFQDRPLTTAQSAQFAQKWNNKISFLLYTHSPGPVSQEEELWQQAYNQGQATETKGREHSYLDLYQPATLTVGGKTLTAKPEIDGPYGDQFTLPAGTPEFRYLGVVHYTFDLTGLPTNGTVTLNFKDSTGKTYNQQANLSQLR